MPLFVCPQCGVSAIIPLAFSEVIIENLFEKGHFVSVEVRDILTGFAIPLTCDECAPATQIHEPLDVGSTVEIGAAHIEQFQKLNYQVRDKKFGPAIVTKVFRLFDGTCVYLIVDVQNVEACAVRKWLAN